MQNWPRAVLFDFDGIIVNSEPLHFHAMREALSGEHIDISEDEYYRDLIGFDDRGAFKHVYATRKKPLEPKAMLALMTNKSRLVMDLIHRRKFNALPGAEEFVRSLWRKLPLAICSGALREEIEAMLEGVSLRDCFSVIVAAEDVTVGKPDPQGYLMALKQLGEKTKQKFKPEESLIVEDAPTVIKSVKGAGFPTLGVATSYPISKLAEANWQVSTLKPEEVAGQVTALKWVNEPRA